MRSIDLYAAVRAVDNDILERSETAVYEQKNREPRAIKFGRRRSPAALIAAIIALLALCGFAAYELGLFDPWLQKPSADPVKTVQSAIEGQAGKDYTITVRVDEIMIDEAETERVKARYIGSELAEAWGWTDEYLEEHFIVVWAKYYVEYDHTIATFKKANNKQKRQTNAGNPAAKQNRVPYEPRQGAGPDFGLSIHEGGPSSWTTSSQWDSDRDCRAEGIVPSFPFPPGPPGQPLHGESAYYPSQQCLRA